MKRKIVIINKDKCTGCGLCVNACHEGALALIDGKATLVKENYCDGFGDCLPACPADAISFEVKEAERYDHKLVAANNEVSASLLTVSDATKQWPVQLKLMPVKADYYHKCHLLLCADCVGFVYRNIYEDYIKDKVRIIACPKLDNEDYSVKLSQIFANNEIAYITVLKMEVPCCNGLVVATKRAMQASGKTIKMQVVTISTEGEVLAYDTY